MALYPKRVNDGLPKFAGQVREWPEAVSLMRFTRRRLGKGCKVTYREVDNRGRTEFEVMFRCYPRKRKGR